MPTPDFGPDYVDGETASAAIFNDKFDLIKALLDKDLTGLDAENIQDGIVDLDLLASDVLAVLAGLGANVGGNVAHGHSIILPEGSRTNTAYGALDAVSGTGAGPDQVANLVLPNGGIVVAIFNALWKESVAGAARAALFLGAVQAKSRQYQVAAPAAQEAKMNNIASGVGTGNLYTPLATSLTGLRSPSNQSAAVNNTDDVTTGQIIGAEQSAGGDASSVNNIGGATLIFADPGTYTASVQFKASSGAVTAKSRRLYVAAVGY